MRSAAKIISEIIVVFGSLACVLVWLEIKPRDLSVNGWQHWFWLVLASVLYLLSLASSVRSWWLCSLVIPKLKEEHIRQTTELEKAHGEALESLRLSMFEKIQAEHGFSRFGRNSPGPFHGANTGFRIESARFAAQDDAPIDVIDKVCKRVADGEPDVPVNWNYLTGTDPHPYQEKFLTINYSVTGRENWAGIIMPNGLLVKSLDELALALKQIQQHDKQGRIGRLDSQDWLTQVDYPEVLARNAREKCFA